MDKSSDHRGGGGLSATPYVCVGTTVIHDCCNLLVLILSIILILRTSRGNTDNTGSCTLFVYSVGAPAKNGNFLSTAY